jgi:3-oxoadipate enol-lactonase
MYDAVSDPYCYPGTTVLKNRAGVRTQAELNFFEEEATAQRFAEPLPSGQLDVRHYCGIHRHLFQDVYTWAGTFRTVRISKAGSAFCYPENIDREMGQLFADLARQKKLCDLDAAVFANKAVEEHIAGLAGTDSKRHDATFGAEIFHPDDAGMAARVSEWFPTPSVASMRRIATKRLTMNIVEAGSGPPVLLIHGLGWDHSLWNPTVERLAKHCRVVAADTRGHGATDRPDGPYDMEMLARDYAALADALGLAGICVIGLSQGGMVAQSLTLLRPDLVCALVLISTSCKSDLSLRDNMEARIAAMEKAGPEAAARAAAESIFSPHWRAANPAALMRFIAWRSAMPTAPLTAATRALYDFDLSRELSRIAVPTLVVAGQEDTLTRPHGMQEMAALVPGAEYRLVPGSGHMIPVEQPEALHALVATFLAEHVLRSRR